MSVQPGGRFGNPYQNLKNQMEIPFEMETRAEKNLVFSKQYFKDFQNLEFSLMWVV